MDDDLERTARIAADPDAAVMTRVDALAHVVDVVSLGAGPIPDAIHAALAEAIDDLALVDAAISARHAGAVIAAVVLIGPQPQLASSRRRVVRRLVAAGGTGIALAGLAISIGDVASGVTLFVRDYRDSIVPRLDDWRLGSHALVGAWLAIVAEQPDDAALAILGALEASGASLDQLCAHAPDARRKDRLDQLRRALVAS